MPKLTPTSSRAGHPSNTPLPFILDIFLTQTQHILTNMFLSVQYPWTPTFPWSQLMPPLLDLSDHHTLEPHNNGAHGPKSKPPTPWGFPQSYTLYISGSSYPLDPETLLTPFNPMGLHSVCPNLILRYLIFSVCD